MSKLRVNSFSISIDGYGAGPNQSLEQYFEAGLIDELHLAISPILLGSGELLFANLDTLPLGYHCSEHVATAGAMHCVLTKRS